MNLLEKSQSNNRHSGFGYYENIPKYRLFSQTLKFVDFSELSSNRCYQLSLMSNSGRFQTNPFAPLN